MRPGVCVNELKMYVLTSIYHFLGTNSKYLKMAKMGTKLTFKNFLNNLSLGNRNLKSIVKTGMSMYIHNFRIQTHAQVKPTYVKYNMPKKVHKIDILTFENNNFLVK